MSFQMIFFFNLWNFELFTLGLMLVAPIDEIYKYNKPLCNQGDMWKS